MILTLFSVDSNRRYYTTRSLPGKCILFVAVQIYTQRLITGAFLLLILQQRILHDRIGRYFIYHGAHHKITHWRYVFEY